MPSSSHGSVSVNKGSSSGSLFQRESGIPLSKSSFVKHVSTALEQAGLPAKNYAGHT